ncbi:hypothetical protein Sa4125_30720 [Aureimonas sp. SA4125]|nr:hypothetical protein Sa4125_30720 [Aureimonas sp. SA4125]
MDGVEGPDHGQKNKDKSAEGKAAAAAPAAGTTAAAAAAPAWNSPAQTILAAPEDFLQIG